MQQRNPYRYDITVQNGRHYVAVNGVVPCGARSWPSRAAAMVQAAKFQRVEDRLNAAHP